MHTPDDVTQLFMSERKASKDPLGGEARCLEKSNLHRQDEDRHVACNRLVQEKLRGLLGINRNKRGKKI